MSIKLKITDRTDVEFPIIIKDEKGNIIYCQYGYDLFYECTHDINGNELTYKGILFSSERTYDENDYELTYKDSRGNYEIKGIDVTKEEYESFINNKL
jgi:hypothetical protein